MTTNHIPTGLTYPKLRAIAFHTHRWLGLIAGILLCIAGVTGSILVFWHEIDGAVLAAQFGLVVPTGELLSPMAIAETVKAAYASKGLTLSSLRFPDRLDKPYVVSLLDAANHYLQVFVNPYTGKIIGDRQWETSWIGMIYGLHYKLLAGDTGTLIMGVVALLTVIINLTGIVLWPGWRKLATGFKIKWNAHIKRRNFDLHKVAGIVTGTFLVLIGFTGFAWNVPQAQVTAGIYAITLTNKPADPISQLIPGQSPLPITELIQRANAVVPNAKTTYIFFANKPESPFLVAKKQSQETSKYGNTRIYLDQFTGKVIQLQNGVKPSRAEAILNQFGSVHFGTFGGLPTRILYVFVGLTPLLLLITGLIMWLYRQNPDGGKR
ncbi:PepSY domain-containing protein [Nostoc sp. TCL26-01]|uniref:PepSY-associated TM helix domain-containing protein n=1 Tax=Nostoc sp. TCL26-01 TaxID=2576904 RepID=UPI0015B82EE8|nr:PepSY-associated TM helix domain-containing protein [Nostoc sp. TCL26-01]QLE54273.1 PepSY domain-containing protein [Nostoc sp. TCL26-01]